MAFELTGVDELIANVRSLRDRTESFDVFLEEEAARLDALVDESWAARRSPAGRRWPPYKDPSRTGGSLRTAHRTTVEGGRLVFRVDHHAASFQFSLRNPTPFGPGGKPDAEWAAGHAQRAREYLLGGQSESEGER